MKPSDHLHHARREHQKAYDQYCADKPDAMHHALAAVGCILEYLDAHATPPGKPAPTEEEFERTFGSVPGIHAAMYGEATVSERRVESWCNSIEHAKNGCPSDCPDQRVIEGDDQAAALDAYVYALANGPPHIRESWSGLSDEARGFFVLFFRFARGIGRLENANSIPQPATGDGTGAALDEGHVFVMVRRKLLAIVGAEDECQSIAELLDMVELEVNCEYEQKVAAEEQAKELKSKLAAAEAELSVFRDTLETRVHHVAEAIERAEKAEARVLAWAPVVEAVGMATSPSDQAPLAIAVSRFDEIPAELRPEVKP